MRSKSKTPEPDETDLINGKDVVDYLNNRSDFEGWSLSVVNLQSFLRRQSSQKRSRQRAGSAVRSTACLAGGS